MPRTNYAQDSDNPLAQIFWGRVRLEGVSSLFRFEKGSRYQTLLHLLKYKGARKVGKYLGLLLGSELLNSSFEEVDYIVPVPLHKKKERLRGYNQSYIIAEGVSEQLNKPIINTILIRIKHTDSQTNKARWERYENLENGFQLGSDFEEYSNKTLLLIDDVLTTGSTLEACALALNRIPNVKIFVATVACA